MGIEASFRAVLTGTTAVSDIISTRVYPWHAPTNATLPYVIYGNTGGGTVNRLAAATSTFHVTFQVDILDDSYADVKTLADAVRTALNGWTDTDGTPAVSSCLLTDENDEFDPPEDDSEQGVYRVIQEYSIWYS